MLRDLETDESTLEVVNDDGTLYLAPIDLEMQRTVLTGNSTHFLPHADLDAHEGEGEVEQRVFSENGDYEIPRDLN